MENIDLKKLFAELRKRMSLIDVSGMRDSRRVDGLYSMDQETRGFTNMIIYIDQGLASQAEYMADILHEMDRYLGGSHGDRRMRYLFSFGNSEGKLVRHTQTDIRRLSLEQWCKWTAAVDHGLACQVSATIPELFSGKKYGSSPCPGKSDLLIFFSRDRCATMGEAAAKKYAGLKKNSLWFFLGEGRFEWEFGFATGNSE